MGKIIQGEEKLANLHPAVQAAAYAVAGALSTDSAVLWGERSNEDQDALYAQGRTVPGDIVTNAKAGQSPHNYRLAVDLVPVRGSQQIWDMNDPVWKQYAAAANGLAGSGITWGGNFRSFKDYDHLELTAWKSNKDWDAAAAAEDALTLPEDALAIPDLPDLGIPGPIIIGGVVLGGLLVWAASSGALQRPLAGATKKTRRRRKSRDRAQAEE